MNREKKKPMGVIFLLVLVLGVAACFPVCAAAKKERIKSIKLKVECPEKPAVGEKIGSVKVTVSDDRVEVSEEAKYYDTEDAVWIRGETPVIRVEFAVKDSDKHQFTSATKVTVSGIRGEVKSKKVIDSGKGIRVEIRLQKVKGALEVPDDYYWEGETATWNEVDDALKYEVRLYRRNTAVTTVTVKDCEYNFYPYMDRAGEYTFRVRALGRTKDERSGWSERSETLDIQKGEVYNGPIPGRNDQKPSGNGGSVPNGWIQDSYGWKYYQQSYQPVRDSWLYVDNNWFFLGNDGYMKTSWLYVDNNWFYLNPISDGSKGAMKTGWQTVDGNVYYLNPVCDGSRGAMKTGWQMIDGQTYFFNPVSDGTRGARRTGYWNIDGRWYYFDAQHGGLWKNRQVPDGRWADGSGALQ